MKKRKANNKNLYTAAAIIITLAAVLLISKSGGFLPGLFSSIQKSVASYAFYVNDTFRSIKYVTSAKKGIQILSEKNMLLESENHTLKAENEKIKRASVLKSMRDFRSSVVCFASVIGANDDGMLAYYTIDRGSADGAGEGDGVITQAGVVGRLVKVNSDTSMVQLITDSKSSVSARGERSRVVGILSGESYNRCALNYVPKEEDIKEGDVIITSGLGKSFPEGIKIGQVTEATKKTDGLSMIIKVKPFVNMMSVEEVIVVKKKQ